MLDVKRRQVWKNGKEICLTSKEYDILEYLIQNKGNVVSVAQIYEYVWRDPFYHAENTVMMHISNLRNKLHSDGEEADAYIQTIWGRGYKI